MAISVHTRVTRAHGVAGGQSVGLTAAVATPPAPAHARTQYLATHRPELLQGTKAAGKAGESLAKSRCFSLEDLSVDNADSMSPSLPEDPRNRVSFPILDIRGENGVGRTTARTAPVRQRRARPCPPHRPRLLLRPAPQAAAAVGATRIPACSIAS